MITKTISTIAAIVLFSGAALVNGQCADPNCTSCASANPTVIAPAPAPALTNFGGQSACTSCQPAVANDCGCKKPGCLKGRENRTPILRGKMNCGCSQCPKCEGDVCELKLDNSKVKKKCFKVEQKSVCVPTVRMPWQKCCPPGRSKTRLVNKLSTHSYECPNCAYKWSVVKPEQPEEPKAAKPAPTPAQPTQVYDSYLPEGARIVPSETIMNTEVYDPSAGSMVPAPIVDRNMIQRTIINGK